MTDIELALISLSEATTTQITKLKNNIINGYYLNGYIKVFKNER